MPSVWARNKTEDRTADGGVFDDIGNGGTRQCFCDLQQLREIVCGILPGNTSVTCDSHDPLAGLQRVDESHGCLLMRLERRMNDQHGRLTVVGIPINYCGKTYCFGVH